MLQRCEKNLGYMGPITQEIASDLPIIKVNKVTDVIHLLTLSSRKPLHLQASAMLRTKLGNLCYSKPV